MGFRLVLTSDDPVGSSAPGRDRAVLKEEATTSPARSECSARRLGGVDFVESNEVRAVPPPRSLARSCSLSTLARTILSVPRADGATVCSGEFRCSPSAMTRNGTGRLIPSRRHCVA